MEIDHLSDKLRAFCNKQQKAINDNGNARSKVYNEVYYGLLSASNALYTLRKARMTVDPMPRNGGELLYHFVSPRIEDLVKAAIEEQEKAEITGAWLDIQCDLCDLATAAMTADRFGFGLFEK